MKDIKLIETIVITYFHENKNKIDKVRLRQILEESLEIEIGSVKLDGDNLIIYYGPKTKRKKVLFEIHEDKIKHRKE